MRSRGQLNLQPARIGPLGDEAHGSDPDRNGRGKHWAVGRMLRTLRLAALVSVDDAAMAARVTPTRMRELERGREVPTFFEADGLATELLSPRAWLCSPSSAPLMRMLAQPKWRGSRTRPRVRPRS
jgi:hypothetical protein